MLPYASSAVMSSANPPPAVTRSVLLSMEKLAQSAGITLMEVVPTVSASWMVRTILLPVTVKVTPWAMVPPTNAEVLSGVWLLLLDRISGVLV